MSKLLRSFVNGRSIPPSSRASSYQLRNPATAEDIYHYQFSPEQQVVDEAVQAAKNAQKEWAARCASDRSAILRNAADAIASRAPELARLETLDTGRPIAETSSYDLVSASDCLNYYAGLVATTTMGGQALDLPGGSWGYTRREPLGVGAGIGAWNYPLQSALWKSAPALAFGNALVFKPSEETPLTALQLAELYQRAGVPDGVFNVVLGGGSVGQALTQHADICKVSFTGSVATGKAVYAAAAQDLKKVTLELGGKSPLIIFDDAHLDNAVSAAMLANWYSNGQVCSNGTRVFVHKNLLEEFTHRLVERTLKLRIGDPMDPNTDIGPMAHQRHMNKVLEYIDIGKKEGAQLLCGGERLEMAGELAKGYYLSPAIFADCADDMTIVKEEIFGMVLALLSFEEEDEVIQRANNTNFGLAAGVFTKDIQRAHRVIHQLQAGTTWINNYNLAPPELPWGGYKQSGIGRENGLAGVDAWTQWKSVYVEMGDIDCPYR